MSKIYGGIHQIGYIVKDIEKAMEHWSRVLGVGPWFYREDATPSVFTYYGKESTPPKISIAVANSDFIQLELIQQHDDAPSLYRDSLKAAGGDCMQHVAFWTEDHYDELRAQLIEAGYVEGHAGQMGQRGRFTYLVHKDLPSCVIEISETRGGKGEYFKKVAEAAQEWDGKVAIIRV
ncbi:VOC family protein [Cupriavidus sp. BIC8F]|uniref:VOC family protein n=1 Tax=Cupriavidus sp. BIC8F TaxID=3079014 RepID=UPI002916D5E8|nr:VOC family protein [Cupriavidus sp. BIC8F]